ncbi:MAG: hypothetical protein CMM02_02080 [Rhodopirellula sp.]|jgi:hypothetical protein|nr:hypothetical protein [Rhodopirellula sp.]
MASRGKSVRTSTAPSNTEAEEDAKIYSKKDVENMMKVASLEATVAELRKANESQAKAFETTVTNIGKGMSMNNGHMSDYEGGRTLLLTNKSGRNMPPREARPKAPAGKKQLYCREMSKKIYAGKDDPKEGDEGCLLDLEFRKKFLKATKWNGVWQATTGATNLGEKGAMACLGNYYEHHETDEVRTKFEEMANVEKKRYEQERGAFFEMYGKKAGMRDRKPNDKSRKKARTQGKDKEEEGDKSEEDNSDEENGEGE